MYMVTRFVKTDPPIAGIAYGPFERFNTAKQFVEDSMEEYGDEWAAHSEVHITEVKAQLHTAPTWRDV